MGTLLYIGLPLKVSLTTFHNNLYQNKISLLISYKCGKCLNSMCFNIRSFRADAVADLLRF